MRIALRLSGLLVAILLTHAGAAGPRAEAAKNEIAGVHIGDSIAIDAVCKTPGWSCKTRSTKMRGKAYTKTGVTFSEAANKDFREAIIKAIDGKVVSIRAAFRSKSPGERTRLLAAYGLKRRKDRSRQPASGTVARLMGNSIQLLNAADFASAKRASGKKVDEKGKTMVAMLTLKDVVQKTWSPTLLESLAGLCSELEMDKPPTATSLPQGTTESVRVRIDNKGTCASLAADISIRIGSGEGATVIGTLSIAPMAAKTGRTLYVPVDASKIPMGSKAAEVVLGKTVLGTMALHVIAGTATLGKPDLVVKSLAVSSATNAKPEPGSELTLTATIANQATGNCVNPVGSCAATGDLTVRFHAPNVDEIVVKIADKLKAGETRIVKQKIKVMPKYPGEVISVSASVDPDPAGEASSWNNAFALKVPTAYPVAKAPTVPAIGATVTLDKLECLAEDDLTSVWHGDDPFMYITGLPFMGNGTTVMKQWSDVESDSGNNTRSIDYKVLNKAVIPQGDSVAFHMSLWEEDNGLQTAWNPDDEIDFTYVVLDWSEAKSLVGKGPQKRTYDFRLVDKTLASWPITHYRVYATIEFSQAGDIGTASSMLPMVPIARWSGDYEMNLDGDHGSVHLQSNQPTGNEGLMGELYGTWIDAKGTKRTINTERLWGNLWVFTVAPDGKGSWRVEDQLRFVGYLMGNEGQESIAGTASSLAGNAPWNDDSARPFFLRRKVTNGGTK